MKKRCALGILLLACSFSAFANENIEEFEKSMKSLSESLGALPDPPQFEGELQIPGVAPQRQTLKEE